MVLPDGEGSRQSWPHSTRHPRRTECGQRIYVCTYAVGEERSGCEGANVTNTTVKKIVIGNPRKGKIWVLSLCDDSSPGPGLVRTEWCFFVFFVSSFWLWSCNVQCLTRFTMFSELLSTSRLLDIVVLPIYYVCWLLLTWLERAYRYVYVNWRFV